MEGARRARRVVLTRRWLILSQYLLRARRDHVPDPDIQRHLKGMVDQYLDCFVVDQLVYLECFV